MIGPVWQTHPGDLACRSTLDALARFARYRDLLLERSAQFNLTAIRDPEEIERRLFLDAIAMVPELDRLTGDSLAIEPTARSDWSTWEPALGFPGLP